MKKKFFLIGALVAMSMSAMFVACKGGNNPTNGCKCTATYEDGETRTESITLAVMKEEFGITSCAELATLQKQQAELRGISASVTCSAY